jgi:hypothetical protein
VFIVAESIRSQRKAWLHAREKLLAICKSGTVRFAQAIAPLDARANGLFVLLQFPKIPRPPGVPDDAFAMGVRNVRVSATAESRWPELLV